MMVDQGKEMVPKLRFPQFNKPWNKEHRGRELFASSRARGSAELPIYSVTLNDGLVPRESLERHMAADAADESNLRATPGDLVYNMMRMWQGAFGLAEIKCMVSPAYVVLSPHSIVDSVFFAYNLRRARPLYDLWAYSYGLMSDRLRLYYRDFGQIKFMVPSVPEQQKIADFLSAVDNKLTALRRKRELLQTYKRGMMQKLFSQELRFKADDGSEFKQEWKNESLGAICTLVTSGSRDWTKYYSTIGAKFIRMTNLPKHGIRLLLHDIKYVSLPESGSEGERASLQPKNILISITAELGKIGFIPDDLGEAYINQHTALVRIKNSKSDPCFVAYNLATNDSRKRLTRLNDAGAKAGLNLKTIKRFCIDLPSRPIQNKISIFLTALDTKIDAVTQQIDRMEIFKKGLLQKLFI